jgi:hypothetical protein
MKTCSDRGLKGLGELTMKVSSKGLACFCFFNLGSAALAQSSAVHVQTNMDFATDCSQPIALRNYVTHAEGAGVLNADRSASYDISFQGSLTSYRVHFEGRLGGAPAAAPGGTSSIHVLGRDRIRLIWSLPSHDNIVDIKTNGRSCKMSLSAQLKPGFSAYQIYTGQGFATCSRPRPLRTSCRAY